MPSDAWMFRSVYICHRPSMTTTRLFFWAKYSLSIGHIRVQIQKQLKVCQNHKLVHAFWSRQSNIVTSVLGSPTRLLANVCNCIAFIMAALWYRAGHYIFALWFLSSSFYLSLFFPRLISAVAEWMSAILPRMVWPKCESRMQVWNVLHAARWKYIIQDAKMTQKKSPYRHHLTTLSGCVFAIKACIEIGKKLVKQQYLLHMSS